jgi:hypothetical protein
MLEWLLPNDKDSKFSEGCGEKGKSVCSDERKVN